MSDSVTLGLQLARLLVYGILQGRIQEWVGVSSSRGSSWLTQGSNPGLLLLTCIGRQVFLPLAPPGKSPSIAVELKTLFDFAWKPLRTSLVAQMVKNLPIMRETWVRPLGWEDRLKEDMATHSSILAGESPWTEKPDWLQSMGSQRVRHDWVTKFVQGSWQS